MAHVIALLGTLVVAWLGMLNPATATVPVTNSPVAIDSYDDLHHAAALTHITHERGPPFEYDRTAAEDAVDRGSSGDSARTLAETTPAVLAYDDSALHGHANGELRTSTGIAEVFRRDLSLFPGFQVAAKAGPALGPARNTDLVLDSFRKLGPGRNAHVRTAGSVDELQETFNAWTVGAERVASRGPRVPDVYRLPDGGVIQWRTSSGTGGPTIDIFPVSGRQRTVHLADGVPW